MNYCSITVYLRYTIDFLAILEQKRSIIASLALPVGVPPASPPTKMGLGRSHWTTPADGLQPSPPFRRCPVLTHPVSSSHRSTVVMGMKTFS